MYCIRDDMKRHGWRWDPDEMCWWHWFTDEALQYAKTHWKPADNNTYNHTKMNKKPTTSNSLFCVYLIQELGIYYWVMICSL